MNECTLRGKGFAVVGTLIPTGPLDPPKVCSLTRHSSVSEVMAVRGRVNRSQVSDVIDSLSKIVLTPYQNLRREDAVLDSLVKDQRQLPNFWGLNFGLKTAFEM